MDRKLKALKFYLDNFNSTDEKQFRTLIVWLEDQKIRQYPIEERQNLKNVSAGSWIKEYQKYLNDVGCPSYLETRTEQLDWLLCLAVKLEYQESADKYSKIVASTAPEASAKPSMVPTNPLDGMDFETQDFKNGVKTLASILNVGVHPDHLITLESISKLVRERLSAEALKNPEKFVVEGTPYPFQDADLGFDAGDAALNQASKILRLLFIADLRDLQTKINECIVEVQRITANPKTDTKLGQVGFK